MRRNCRPPSALAALAALAAMAVAGTLTACTAAPATDGSASSSTTAPASAASTSTSTPSTPSPSSTTTTTPASTDQPRSADDLKRALIELTDMPAGFAIEPATASGDSPQASSKDPKCAAFVARSNLKAAPGSTAHEEIAFSGGQSGPFIREYMDGFASAATAAASLAEYRAAIASCAQVILTVPGGGKSTVTVKTVNPPAYGDTPIATRMTARGGPLNGLEITEVRAAVGNTIVTLNFVATAPADIDGGAQLAVEKARASLDVKTTATS